MSKQKTLVKTGLMAGAVILSGYKDPRAVGYEKTTDLDTTKLETSIKELPSNQIISAPQITDKNLTKREPQKIYHRFEEIPEITDNEALLYKKDEYTYIINQEQYQKDGTIELKRVLKQETTKANTLSLMYRSECHTYNPTPNEDQLVRYIVDAKLISSTGKYKGPSQMDDGAITNFIKFLSASPKYRDYVLPILKNTPSDLQELEKKFYNNDGSIRSMEVREMLLSSKAYQNIQINTGIWPKLASKETKNYIAKKEQELSKRKQKLTSTTKTYFCLTDLFPDNDTFIKALEEYNLSSFALNRQGKPKHILAALALSLNYKDETGNLDATRIPPYAISATLSHVNWQGNGRLALKQAQTSRTNLKQNPNHLKKLVSSWITGKGNRYGVDEISQLNMITPEIVEQYLFMELPGAKNFAQKYQEAIKQKEDNLTKLQELQKAKVVAENKNISKPSIKTLLLELKDFIQTR